MNEHLQLSLLSHCVTGGMMDFQRTVSLANLCLQSQCVHGDVCEFGCYKGWTAALLASLTTKAVYVFDSFSGLPEPGDNDLNVSPYQRGEMKAVQDDVQWYFERHGLRVPTIVQKEFEYLTIADIPSSIAFAHLDSDLYDGTKRVLDLIWPFMSNGGVIVVDDFHHPQLPGVKTAVTEFCKEDYSATFEPTYGINGTPGVHCLIRKP